MSTRQVRGPWRQVEITLTGRHALDRPYVSTQVWADFVHDDGRVLRRPAFYDGGRTWRIRFASPLPHGRWRWTSAATVDDPGLSGITGTIDVTAPDPGDQGRFTQHGFWRMSPGGRSLVHADGRPAILVADTAWALPWRATEEQVRVYAADRQDKGFNAVLLMSVQPDIQARGPADRTQDEGFGVGFADLPDGQLDEIDVTYFQYLDRLLDVFAEHDIVPVLQPVFQGFGWKGPPVAGTVVPAESYARYCRYLVARYGARPAIWLVGADGSGLEPQVAAGGAEAHAWDCYGQPTGVHYRPNSDNRAHQAADWLDFQWCQTGHTGEHVPERVADMWRNLPAKAVANAEPTYEGTRTDDMAAGWWQGHEAWGNLCAGGTMGIVYGAANIWQWKLGADEPGHSPYFAAAHGGWRESLDFAGSRYAGLVGRILDGLPTTDMVPDWGVHAGPRGLRIPGRLQIVYQERERPLRIRDDDTPKHYRIIDPRTGDLLEKGYRVEGQTIGADGDLPRVIVFCDEQ